MFKYAFEIREETQALAVFLNDGVEVPMTEDPHVLFIKINGPREITSKIMNPREMILQGVPEDTLFFKK